MSDYVMRGCSCPVTGHAERTGWVRTDDRMLMRDLNGSGRIDNITQIFRRRDLGGRVLSALDGNNDARSTRPTRVHRTSTAMAWSTRTTRLPH